MAGDAETPKAAKGNMSSELLGDLIGRSVPRVEDARLLRGQARYIDDIVLPDMLHAVFARSRSAHARIKSADTAAAKALPGVHAVLLYADLRPLLTCDRIPLALAAAAVKFDAEPSCLVDNEACYAGEPIALVVADNRPTAEDAAALIEVDYDELPAVTDPYEGLQPGASRARTI
jgi:aerobic carbon-monoxide dehydrogenase large subunit